MKTFKILAYCLGLALTTLGCKTEMIERIDLLALENGGYMRNLDPWPQNALRFTTSGEIRITLEAVGAQQGQLLQSYDLTARFVDRTPANGPGNVANRAFLSIPASAFTPDATTRYPRTIMTLRAAALIQTLGLNAADVRPGDQFEIDAVLRQTNGRSFSLTNSGSNITGGAYYRSPFFYRITVE
jgi:hypothetical protein